ncbi:diaminobutyrate--2-oxoglutarate transaminase [Sneathiella sp. CAU 1612]|uniref:Diaminobutyrate--2-oxoglutarate transaminase n=1 Tax=Sneathiella sedimenti TaxID=2816034 RepID=A0ABS3F638_9PROT|nr:diaminobutyrate--2-oxoglutarate transaminase [Sneathiella sedimenti]
MSIFERRESQVQSYAKSFPVVFDKAQGATLTDEKDNKFIDFLAGAGSLNYGHNDPDMREALIEYLGSGGITHGLDMHTKAKAAFLNAFEQYILEPRKLDYVLQFTGPTGANAVEAALKLARKVTGRSNVISFTNGFHGVTLGALATTGNEHHRGAAGVDMPGSSTMPYDGYLGKDLDSTEYLDRALGDPSSGVDLPAAVIVECVQGEGGLTAARIDWLQNLEQVCRRHDVLLIVDDIQAGCGRTGTFFSFEPAGIKPDMVTLSKSLSGYGLPFAVTLINRDLDIWEPGEHNGTFRGNNHAFVTATVALEKFWQDDSFANGVKDKGEKLLSGFKAIQENYADQVVELRGRGMMRGIVVESGDLASRIVEESFKRGLVIETSGAHGEVVKCLASLTITDKELARGLDILNQAFDAAINAGNSNLIAAE